MNAGVGTTTVTHAASAVASVAARGLVLVWRFPRASAPPIALHWEGDGELLIGRDPSCAVQLEGTDVSRRHAVLRKRAPGVVIADLGSHNGVQVNGRPVAETPLHAGDVVRIGGGVGVVTVAAGDVVE